jgi:hypothetical protein
MRWTAVLAVGGCAGEAPVSPEGGCGAGLTEVPYDGVDNDCDPLTPDDDLDGDGFLLASDCDDLDAERGGPEIVLDGIDNDCDGVQGVYGDADGDGLSLTDDCDDTDASVGSSNALGVAGYWEGDVTAAEVPGFCEGYCRRPIGGSVRLEASELQDLDELWCVPRIVGDLVIGGIDTGDYGTVTDLGNARLASLSGLSGLLEVGGGLFIQGNDALTSLQGLEQLVWVGGWLHLEDQPALTSLQGLAGLQEAGSLALKDNDGLTSLQGLEQLQLDGVLAIEQNDQLTSLAGLGAPSALRRLSVFNNDALPSLAGLEALRSLDTDLFVGSNDSLTDLGVLYGLESVGGDVTVTLNTALGDEAAWDLVDEIELVGGAVTIYGNEAGAY